MAFAARPTALLDLNVELPRLDRVKVAVDVEVFVVKADEFALILVDEKLASRMDVEEREFALFVTFKAELLARTAMLI